MGAVSFVQTSKIEPSHVSGPRGPAPKAPSAQDFAKAIGEDKKLPDARVFSAEVPGYGQRDTLSFGTGRNRVNVYEKGGHMVAERPGGPSRKLTGSEVEQLRGHLKAQTGTFTHKADPQNVAKIRQFASELPKPMTGAGFKAALSSSEVAKGYTHYQGFEDHTGSLGVSFSPKRGGAVLNLHREGGRVYGSIGGGLARPLSQGERKLVSDHLRRADQQLDAQRRAGPSPFTALPPAPLNDPPALFRHRASPAQIKARFEAEIDQQRKDLAQFRRAL